MYHAVSNNGEHLHDICLNYLTNSLCKKSATNSYTLAYVVNYVFKVFLSLSVKVKVKVKVKFSLEQATKAQKGRRCIALLFLQPLR